MLKKFDIKTNEQGYYNITDIVQSYINENNIVNGLCHIFVPHTTAGVTINENADPDVIDDLILGMDNIFPNDIRFKHMEGNSPAHLKSSNIGCAISVIIDKGKLLLGVWQGIYFAEFDGPRLRSYYIKLLKG